MFFFSKKGTLCNTAVCLSILCGLPALSPTIAAAQDIEQQNSVTRECLGPYIEKFTVNFDTEEHVVVIDWSDYSLTLDGDEFQIDAQDVPLPRTTVDYSTAVNLSCNIPWRGVAAIASVLIATIPGIGWTNAAGIVAAVSAEGNPLYVTMTQHKSIESYYSTYEGAYYKKAINKNIRAYSPQNN